MMNVVSRVYVNLFYYPEPAYLPERVLLGYLKATVTNMIETDHGKKKVFNSYYRTFFVPFMIRPSEYILADHFAVQARDVTPASWNVLQTKWKIDYLNPPHRELPRLEAIVSKLNSQLPAIVQEAIPLKDIKPIQRKRFLGQFPKPLREGLDENVLYGTLGKKNIEYSIFQHELSTDRAESEIKARFLS